MPLRLFRALLTCVVLFHAPEVLADCNPDPPLDGADVVCDGMDETGYDGSGATGLTITTDGVTVIDDSDPGLDSAILVGDDSTVTLGADATVDVTEADGFGVRGNNDNFLVNEGTINVLGSDGRAISLNENTTGVLPNGAVNGGTINIEATAQRGIGLETGTNSGVANRGTINLLADESRGISAANHSDHSIAADVSNLDTINVIGDGAIGIKAGDGWLNGSVPPGGTLPVGPGVRNLSGATIDVSGTGATGIFTGDESNLSFDNNSFVLNNGTIDVSGVDAIGISVGGNDLLDRMDLNSGDFVTASDVFNAGDITGSADAGPLVEFRGFVAGFENRVILDTGSRIVADRTNEGVANRAIAIRGTGGDELVENFGTIEGDVEFGDGDDRYIHAEGASFAGRLLGDAGNDEIILGGFSDVLMSSGMTESFDVSTLFDFERIQISGSDGWELLNTAGFLGRTEIAAGGRMVVVDPTTLGGDFSVDSGGTLDLTLEAASPALTVQGTADFGGTLALTRGATLTPSATPYRVVLAAGGSSGRFQLQETVGLDRFAPTYDTSGLLVTYQRGLDIVAESASQRSIANHLMAVDAAGGATPDLQALIDSFETSTGVLANTLNALSPEVYDFQTQVVVEGGRRIANLLLDRPRECEMGRKDPWGGIDERLPCHARSWAPWVAAIGGFRSRESFDEHRRYDSEMGGLVAGIDSHPIEGLDLTFAIGSQRGTVNAAGAGESTLTFTDVSGHAAWSYGRLRTQAVASWGHGFHQDRRQIYQTETDYALDSRGNEDHDSDRITAAAEIGFLFDVAQFQIEPLVGVDWAWVYQRPIHESGAGGFGIRIASRDESIGSINAGIRLSTTYQHSRYLIRQLEWMDGIWKPSLEVRWRQVVHGDDRDIDARFQGSPDTVPDFRVSGDEDDGGAEIGAGISFTPKQANRLQFDVRYDAFVAEHTVEHDLVGRVMIGF